MTKSYISNVVKNMPESGIRKFFDVANTMKGAISLGVGEPDFETPWFIREAAINSIEKGKTQYTANQGQIELRNAICDYMEERFDLKYNPKNEVVVTVGASEGIDIALRTLINPGDEVLIVEPSFVSYKPCITMTGGVPVCVQTVEENNFKVKSSEILEKITPKTKVLILPFPSNPTGAIMEKSDLEEISKVIIENDIFVISDEIYAELTYGKDHISIASIKGMFERTVVINGFSKTFAMTGWRLGFATGPSDIILAMNKVHQYLIMSAPTMSQFGAVEALINNKRDEEISYMREAYNERRRLMVDGFLDMGLSCFEPEGAFYVFPSIKKTGFTSEDFCQKLLESKSVAVVPGNAFGDCGEGFVRCSYAYSLENLKIALERIGEFVKEVL